MNPINQLASLGQSIWYDNIQRSLLQSGELAAMIGRGEIRGVTSNPSIFHNAIARSSDYDAALQPMAWSGWDAEAIFWQLVTEDIRQTCDLFLPLYQETSGGDGFVSLEVHPALAHDTQATLAQAQHLWERVGRPNLMIKIPATQAGLPAIRAAIAAGININVTLIFSIERYREVMAAYLAGLDEFFARASQGAGKSIPASVASFFISRMDSKVDALLPQGSHLRGKAAIANAKLAYAAFRETFSGARWESLARAGGRFQRPLWASTSTKNPAYPDTLYVDNLVGPDTVNTVPPQTLSACLDHGKAALTISTGLDEANTLLAALESGGISLARVTGELETEGVRIFQEAFQAMLAAIEERRRTALRSLGPLSEPAARRVASLDVQGVPQRLWDGDPALWTEDAGGQAEIRKRLGWLRLPEDPQARLPSIQSFAGDIARAGIERCLLLGMGGSSLAPEVMSLVFQDPAEGACGRRATFAILDSTDPAQVRQAGQEFPPAESLYLVSSKSGGTVEVNAMLEHFWQVSGEDGSRFVAITDPGTSLESLANLRKFRATRLADPSVGGRFSVLADFGLLPMALMGYDVRKCLESAAGMMNECRAEFPAARNTGLVLGAILGEAALAGRDKLTILSDPQCAAFGSWLEQLIAESSGKQGRGIVVVDDEPLMPASSYQDDRLFVYFKVDGRHASLAADLLAAGHPVLEFPVPDARSLFAEFYRWEVATAIACHILGVNAFDQPDVQDNKERTRIKIDAYRNGVSLDDAEPLIASRNGRGYSNQDLRGSDLSELMEDFLGLARQGDYIAINAYLPRNPPMHRSLTDLRTRILVRTGCATTLGFGPRFLHSTGQLHKGGPASGLFLQITADPTEDLEIPALGAETGKLLTFGALERAQALGDYEALQARGRRILRLHFPSWQAVTAWIETLSGTNG